ASGGRGGTIEVPAGSPTGPGIGALSVPVTGGWENYTTVSTTLVGTASGPVYLVFAGAAGGGLFDVDSVTFTRRPAPVTTTASYNLADQLTATSDGATYTPTPTARSRPSPARPAPAATATTHGGSSPGGLTPDLGHGGYAAVVSVSGLVAVFRRRSGIGVRAGSVVGRCCSDGASA